MKKLAAAIFLSIVVGAPDARACAGGIPGIPPSIGFDGESAPLRLEQFLESAGTVEAVAGFPVDAGANAPVLYAAGSSYELLKRAIVLAREMPEVREGDRTTHPRLDALSSVVPAVQNSTLHVVDKAELLVMILRAARSLSGAYHKTELATLVATAMAQSQVPGPAVREEVLAAAAEIRSAKSPPDHSGYDWSWRYRAENLGTIGLAMSRLRFSKEDISGLFKDALGLIRGSSAPTSSDSYWGTDYYPMKKAEALAEAALQMTKAGLGDAASGPVFDEALSVAGVIVNPGRREDTLKTILKKLTEAGEAR